MQAVPHCRRDIDAKRDESSDWDRAQGNVHTVAFLHAIVNIHALYLLMKQAVLQQDVDRTLRGHER